MNYLAPDLPLAETLEADVFANFREQIRATDPDAVAEDGTIIGRNAATGELEPDAARTTRWATPEPAIQGFTMPVPEDEALHPAELPPGVVVTTTFNPWPKIGPDGEPPSLPEWRQPTSADDAYIEGAWVSHNGYDYCSLLAANVWEPTPESSFWRISPDPGPLPWRQPTGAADAYAIGDRVTHPVAGRDTDLWESNINANTTEPGTDGTFDRWWRPILDTGGEVLPWVQPMPGTANAPYEIGARVLHNEQEWVSTIQLNVWEPGVFGWDVTTTGDSGVSQAGQGFGASGEETSLGKPSRPQQLAALRRRNEEGRFVADVPGTAENEAWISGEAPT